MIGAKDLDGSSQCFSLEINEGEDSVRRGAWENAPAFITVFFVNLCGR